MKIILSNQSEKPIYLQIKEQLEEQILSGEIPEDTVLPSIRKMAADLLVSVITTTRAYKELEADGFLRRTVFPEVPPRVEYTLTELGQSFVPVLEQMLVWSEKHLCPPGYVNPYQDARNSPPTG